MALGKGLQSLIPQQKRSIRSIIRKETGMTSFDSEKVWQIPLSEIVPNREQPRKRFSEEDLADLVLSIQTHGVLQPITVMEQEDGGYELIAGERRLRASQMAGKATIPALVRVASRREQLELALIENIQRADLNPIEEAFAYDRLMSEFGLTQQEMADRVGKSRPAVANTIRLLDLPNPIQAALIEGTISMGKARALLGLHIEADQLAMFQSMMGEGITVRDVEHSVRQGGHASGKGSVRRDPNIRAQEQLIEERLGAKVRITKKGDRGTIMIEFHSKDEFRRILEELS